MKSIFKSRLLFFAAVFLFSLICALSAEPVSDDYLLYYAFERPEIRYSAFTNGRYIANRLAYLIVRYPAAKVFCYTVMLSIFILVLSDVTQINRKRQSVSWLSLALFVLMPPAIYSNTIMWPFAFAVHVVPIIFTMFYMQLCFREFSGKLKERKTVLIPLCGLLGFGGAFFVEHVSIFNVVFAGFVLIYAARSKQQKLRAYQIVYAAGALLGLVIMLLNPQYRDVAEGTESETFRTIESDLTEVFYQAYTKVIPLFAKRFFLLHLLIAAAMAFLYLRADQSGWSKERRRYTKLSLGCIAAYALYSVFNTSFVEFHSLTASERMGALECAFVFLYLISVLYLSFVLTERERFLRTAVFLGGTVVSAAPFCIVNPVTPRCFFFIFCFWLLLSLELYSAATEQVSDKTAALLKRAVIISGTGAVSILSYINIANIYVFHFSLRELHKQLDSGRQKVDLVTVPYPAYTPTEEFSTDIVRLGNQARSIDDKLYEGTLEMYFAYMIDYYHLEKIDLKEFHATLIAYHDYTM